MACLEVGDVPGPASTDDLGVLAAQFAPVRRVLLLSAGPGSLGRALVWLEGGADLEAVAEALDCHPLAGGFITARVCSDAMRWVVTSVGSSELLGSAPPPQAPPAALPPTPSQPQPAAWGAAQAPPPAAPSGTGGAAALEAELHELQAALQQQALEGNFDQLGGYGSGSLGEEAEDDGWQEAAPRRSRTEQRPASAGGKAGKGPRNSSGWATASQEPTTKLWVGHVAGHATLDTLTRVFGKFGPTFKPELRRAPEKGRKDQWGFINFRTVEHAEAAYEALNWKKIPELTGDMPLKLQFRPV